ncbi:hypothetical protein SAMN04488601_1012564 [Paenibacillus sp. 453mf]|nr:hypothetical protein SAMN04488601_1012564 [Paenibacillus sp. 453mf]
MNKSEMGILFKIIWKQISGGLLREKNGAGRMDLWT